MDSTLPQMPNFSMISQHHGALAEQFSLFGNIPAVDGGQRLHATMERILARLDTLTQKVDGVDRRVRQLDKSFDVKIKNMLARQQNAPVTHASVPLSPMYDVEDGRLIEDFPANLEELDQLQEGQVDRLLAQLGERGQGRLDARRTQLVTAIGVLQRAVQHGGRRTQGRRP